MIFSLRTHALIAAGLFTAMILVAIGGNVLFANRPLSGGAARVGLILIFGLFLAFGFSMVPVMVLSVTGAQRAIGNAERPMVRQVLGAQKVIIYGLWTILALGCAIAIPAAMADGFFDPAKASAKTPAPPDAVVGQTPTAEPPPLAPDPRYTLPDYKPEERRVAPD